MSGRVPWLWYQGGVNRLVVLVSLIVLSISGTALAQSDEAPPRDGPAESTCFPECRTGFVCQSEECILEAQPQQSESDNGLGEEGDACFPACRAGFLCHERHCISACNPTCSRSETCSEAGECVARARYSSSGGRDREMAPTHTQQSSSAGRNRAPELAYTGGRPPRPRLGAALAFTVIGGAVALTGGLVVAGSGKYDSRDVDCVIDGDCSTNGEWVAGLTLVGLGLVTAAVSIPFLVTRNRRKKAWDRQYGSLPREYALIPSLAVTDAGPVWGLRLSSSF